MDDYIEELEIVEEAVVLTAKQIHEMMQNEVKKFCDVTEVSFLRIYEVTHYAKSPCVVESTERSPPPSFAA